MDHPLGLCNNICRLHSTGPLWILEHFPVCGSCQLYSVRGLYSSRRLHRTQWSSRCLYNHQQVHGTHGLLRTICLRNVQYVSQI